MRKAPPVVLVVVAALAFASCRGACGRADRAAGPLEGRLALLPIDTRSVVALDFDQIRRAPFAAKLSTLAASSPEDEKRLAAFSKRTGLDPVRQIDSIVVGFPEEARLHGEMGVVVRAERFDESRLVAYVRDTLQKDGDDLVTKLHGRRTLWATRKDPSLAGFFLDGRTLVIGGGGWAERMADLADGAPASGSAETNLELVELCSRAAAGHSIWAGAIVPVELRRQLQQDPRFESAASVTRMSLGINLGTGLEVAFTADLADPSEAKVLVAKVSETVQGAKRDPRVLMLGLGPELDGITSRVEGSTFSLKLALGEAQVNDLLDRASAFLKLMRQDRAPGFGH
jgi:hypothetical protein